MGPRKHADDFLASVPLKSKLMGFGIILGPLFALIILGTIFLGSEPLDPKSVWGCYVAKDAPALKISGDQITIMDGSGRAFTYQAEPAKRGYQLSVSPALGLEPSSRRYEFVQQRGTGYFWPLLTERWDDPGAMRSPTDFGGRFSLYTTDGDRVIYARVEEDEACLEGKPLHR